MFHDKLRINLEMRIDDLKEKVVKTLIDNHERNDSLYMDVHNTLVDIFGNGIPWKEDLDKIDKFIEPLSKKDADEFDNAIDKIIIQVQNELEMLKEKKGILHKLLEKKKEGKE